MLPVFRPLCLPQFRYLRNGAALAGLTQSLAYSGVKRAAAAPARKQTQRNLGEIGVALQGECGERPPDAAVWNALRKDPVSKTVRDFVWKAIHGAHRVGAYWKHIPGYEERGVCNVCGVEDSMKHILVECTAPGQALVWGVVRCLFKTKGIAVPTISLGLALGAHMFVVLNEKGDVVVGKTRGARIILTEAVHTIWALRCERVVGWEATPERRHAAQEVLNRIGGKLNKRVQMDQGATNVRTHKKRAIGKAKVSETWRGILQAESEIPEDWMHLTGVLVGIPSLADLRDMG
ncbi:uncharacterized protein TRAVEDRAFT_122133 [Trametes versicolor FP-101664 SS1]|uniref:uncharacterized protein n=1 Tax=Trametes versicolor (strain FP-101664) TaxID=717944 RepID=UPI0004621341|nr:uncharacterized protein TRAVEDRAFT_122133 [Trametes versicolor FP-101664 SS1]EIW59710.1 hypothetical protein TRAVEDRAFT_122133 [Trametes versicolor FP-101664 SS1]